MQCVDSLDIPQESWILSTVWGVVGVVHPVGLAGGGGRRGSAGAGPEGWG